MIIISHIHTKGEIRITRNDEILNVFSGSLVEAFWQICEKFPDELILWKEEHLEINLQAVDEVFQHSLIMASFPVNDYFIPDAIGYVDQLPFVNPERNVKFPTWRMSTDIGGIYGNTAMQFQPFLKNITSFGYLLNSIAKIGQQNSLFCYSAPSLLKTTGKTSTSKISGTNELFSFVAQHYKKIRLPILFLCYIRYENKFPVFSFLNSIFKKSFFQKRVELSEIDIVSKKSAEKDSSIDVIIPTLGRPQHLREVLIDLKNQDLLPKRVIIVEQNPEENSVSQLDYLKSDSWPFENVHHFTHQLGACNARNMALNDVKSDWVFFADDDIRFEDSVIKDALSELNRLKVQALNMNCLQSGEKSVFSKIKQWGAFGSGTSIVNSDFAKSCHFSKEFENGFGEDTDYGIMLRNKGCDIIYHPDIIIKHLKASRGGFRAVMNTEEKNSDLLKPKPSPTMMHLVKKHFTIKMQKGYKMNLFLKFYKKQSIKNPFVYYKTMQERWKLSEKMNKEITELSSD